MTPPASIDVLVERIDNLRKQVADLSTAVQTFANDKVSHETYNYQHADHERRITRLEEHNLASRIDALEAQNKTETAAVVNRRVAITYALIAGSILAVLSAVASAGVGHIWK